MPKQIRWSIKRQLDYAVGNLESAIDKVLSVAKPFEHIHDEYFDAFVKIVASLHVTAEAIKIIRDKI